jgi:hypothetical protein
MLQRGLYRDNGKDENNNFFCGAYLLDYKMAISNHTLGDYITIKTIIENPSDISYNKYPKKSKNFDKANNKPNSSIKRFILKKN